ncbi:MAG: Zn-dependent hydrolase [Gammaproteobacteria bacterium]|nr:Zn-dependent hydrolase [Gammaproteobacteria bacterium]NNF48311.1 Zn-dependent hydrolase [Woeseiaceae bacterium]MBT8093925.1 Zn-dependent hydrolase [Gammaproteobacteria bacterium]MBT8105501.1 Zn-dependent hydrolase [Gammaproteobacteria bacterium]NNK25515.1 Zn-dependent hydrolase [Woeseiaceae bacterium]
MNFQTVSRLAGIVLLPLVIASCAEEQAPDVSVEPLERAQVRPEIYADFTLTADIGHLSDEQKSMVVLLIEASRIMDDLFWRQSYGDDYKTWLASIGDERTRRFAELNYGPWDALDDDRPFMDGFGPKPLGARFYPADMSREEFETAFLPGKAGLYSFVRRDAEGNLVTVPFHVEYQEELTAAAGLLREAAKLAESPDFANYLKLRAAALISDNFQLSDRYWMDVKDNEIDVVIGPIETYLDRLFGYRAAYEAYVLIKDLEWSERLGRYAGFLPQLQAGLPVPDAYKKESPGTNADLNAYDVVYYAGHSNAGSKTIAINLPNDEQVQLEKGSRRLQLKNAMEAKYTQILEPIADVLIDESQRGHITFDAFFANTMFHEVAHGLGIKNTLDGGTVQHALQEYASSMEEGKADILGLYMITELHKAGELGDVDLRDYYVTFMTGIFRSVRFGAASAHGKANMLRFNFFLDEGAFVRDASSGRYSVDFERMATAIENLSRLILTLQGDGDYEGAKELTEGKGIITPALQADLDRLTEAKIPVDITFRQGTAELGLQDFSML